MADLITIPISVFEITIDYACPAIALWSDNRPAIVERLFESWMPWNPAVDDIEIRTTGKISEQGVSLRLPLKRASFFFGPSSCTFTQDGVSWAGADETLRMLNAGIGALTASTAIRLKTRHAAISVHLQPRTSRFSDLLIPFVPKPFLAIQDKPFVTAASVVKWGSRKVTLDGSGVLANAIFLRFERDFTEDSSFDEIAKQLRADQEELFAVLGVEEDLA